MIIKNIVILIIILIILIFFQFYQTTSKNNKQNNKNNKKFNIVLEKKRNIFNLCLRDMKKIMGENNQEFFLVSGTLLGCIREQDFIPYDDDIDIGIFYNKFNQNIINKIIESKKFKLKYQRGDIKESYELTFKHYSGVNIDIFLYYRINLNFYYYATFNSICDYKEKKYCKWGRHIIGLTKVNFKNTEYLIPSNYEQYLKEEYGNDWRIPKKMSYTEALTTGGYKNLIN